MLKCRIAYLLILLVTFLFYLFYPDYLSFLALLFVLLLPVLLFILVIIASRKLSGSLTLDLSSACKKQEFSVQLQIRNRFFLPLSRVKAAIRLQNRLTGEQKDFALFLPVGSHRKETVSWTMFSEHCGQLLISIEKLSVYDYLGLFLFSIPNPNKGCVDIIPNCQEISPKIDMGTQLCLESDLYSTQKPGSDPSETFGIREYIPGDSLRSIHWKLSVKTGQWMIRQFSLPLNHSVVLLIEFSKPTGNHADAIDILLDCMFSLSYFLLLHQVRHRLCWYDTQSNQLEQLAVTCEEDLHTFLHHILQVSCYTDPALALQCYGQQCVNPASHFFYFLPSSAPANLQAMISKFNNHRNTVLAFGEAPSLDAASASFEIVHITPDTLQGSLDQLWI